MNEQDDDYVYTGAGRFPWQYIPKRFLDEQQDDDE
jgi:hypothetical protein